MLRILALVYACGIGERCADDLAAALARAGCGSHARSTADHVQVLTLVARQERQQAAHVWHAPR